MSKSIMQSSKECYLTGETYNLHKHHIFGGANRRLSESNGFWVYLAAELHNGSDKGVHYDAELDAELKEACQRKYEETHSRKEFMAIIGRNYLD